MTSADEAIEVRARSVEAAIEEGLTELGLGRDDVEIRVLHPGSRGVLGIGAEDAVVRLTPQLPAAEEEAVEPEIVKEAKEPVTEAEEVEVPAEIAGPAAAPEPAAAEEEMSQEETATLAQGLLADLLMHLGVDAEVLARYGEAAEGNGEPPLMLDVMGKDLGILIGRRGDTLAALQFLTRLMLNRHTHRWINLTVDVEGYKARRERTLRELALRMAERAVATGRVVALEAMPPAERRIVHLTLRDHADVTTQSIGEGEGRKVTIIPH